jgi:hypothetical protein
MKHNPLFDRLWGMDGSHPFGDPFKFEEYMEKEEFETEICEFIKGDYKTLIICKFNKAGYMVSHSVEVQNMAETNTIMSNLREELFQALDDERYEDAKVIHEKINQLRFITEIKPTL